MCACVHAPASLCVCRVILLSANCRGDCGVFTVTATSYTQATILSMRTLKLSRTWRLCVVVVVAAAVLAVLPGGTRAQRAPFAGKKPIGYPELTTAPSIGLENKFGDGDDTSSSSSSSSSASLPPLPVQAQGDRELVNRISKLPVDQQPFWYLNWKVIEAQRKNPQTFQPNQNSFSDPALPMPGSGAGSGEHGPQNTNFWGQRAPQPMNQFNKVPLDNRQGGSGGDATHDPRQEYSDQSERHPLGAQPTQLNVNNPSISNNYMPMGSHDDRTEWHNSDVYMQAKYPTSNPQTFQPNQNSFSDLALPTPSRGAGASKQKSQSNNFWGQRASKPRSQVNNVPLDSPQRSGGDSATHDTHRDSSDHSERHPLRARPTAPSNPSISTNNMPIGSNDDRTASYDKSVNRQAIYISPGRVPAAYQPRTSTSRADRSRHHHYAHVDTSPQ